MGTQTIEGVEPDLQLWALYDADKESTQRETGQLYAAKNGFEWVRFTVQDGIIYMDAWTYRPTQESPFKVRIDKARMTI